MNYGTVCSGIEAPSQAWHPLGWTPEFFSEIPQRAAIEHRSLAPAATKGLMNFSKVSSKSPRPPCRAFRLRDHCSGTMSERHQIFEATDLETLCKCPKYGTVITFNILMEDKICHGCASSV